MFQNPVDIANRACQHMGVKRITDFVNDTSVQAGELSFVYDKVRRAELRRNVWQFATRRAALRAIDQQYGTTKILQPSLWSSGTTYTMGSLAIDSANVIWQSRADDNINNAPGNSSQWEQYTGPMTAYPYDTTGQTAYFAGELVYETPGDGTFLVYLSTQSQNTQDPRMPTLWVNSSVAQLPPSPLTPVPNAVNPTPGMYSLDDVVLYYAAWAIGTTYAAGNTVSFNGTVYVSLAAGNVGNEPDIVSAKWAAVPVSPAPQFYNALTAYSIGTFVTYKGVNYVALTANTGVTPVAGANWAQQAAGTYYVSMIDFNLNNDPSLAPAAWVSTTTYTAGQTVCGANGLIYTALVNSTNQNPLTTTGYWSTANVLCPWTSVDNFGTASESWLQILNVSLLDIVQTSPIGVEPTTSGATRNMFMLPANFLRRAPQDPKAGSSSFLGAPTGLRYDDWEFEGKYLVTREPYPIVLRFVADVTDVTSFDDMFCEGLAARMAMEVCERVTQATQKTAACAAAYKLAISDARTINGIETGAVEPPEDDYIACRW